MPDWKWQFQMIGIDKRSIVYFTQKFIHINITAVHFFCCLDSTFQITAVTNVPMNP